MVARVVCYSWKGNVATVPLWSPICTVVPGPATSRRKYPNASVRPPLGNGARAALVISPTSLSFALPWFPVAARCPVRPAARIPRTCDERCRAHECAPQSPARCSSLWQSSTRTAGPSPAADRVPANRLRSAARPERCGTAPAHRCPRELRPRLTSAPQTLSAFSAENQISYPSIEAERCARPRGQGLATPCRSPGQAQVSQLRRQPGQTSVAFGPAIHRRQLVADGGDLDVVHDDVAIEDLCDGGRLFRSVVTSR